jgi:AcrR family transcriptional regulator
VASNKRAPGRATADKPRIRKRASRRTPNIEEILTVTLELLEHGGETGFRLEDLMGRTGVSKSSIYLHFGDRDGLLAAAYGKKFEEIVRESLSGLELMMNQMSSPRAARDAARAATAFVASPERFKNRLDRAVIIAGIRGRQKFAAELAKAQTALTDRLVVILMEGQERGFIRMRHSPRAIAQMIQAVTFGRIIAELEGDGSPELRQSWTLLVDDILDAMLFDGLINE